jgi:hypothetical protein
MWEKGRPLGEVLHSMRSLVDEACTKLKEMGFGKAEVAMYRTLSKSGAVTQDVLVEEMTKKKINRQDALALCGRLIRLDLIHKDSAHRLLMVEHPSNVMASMSAGRLKPDSVGKFTTRQTSSGKNS